MKKTQAIAQPKKDFKPYPVGTVFNSITVDNKLISSNPLRQVVIDYPTRLEAMAIDPSKIAANDNLKYTPGQIDFTVSLFKRVTVQRAGKDGEIEVSKSAKRPSLIRHSAEIMRKALGVSDGLLVDVEDNIGLRHCGLGSSSGLIAGVACAINEMYGKPINDRLMVKYLAQNHGEEIDGDNNLVNPVQCIGGSASCGTHSGCVVIIAGENVVVKTSKLDLNYEVVIGVPRNFEYPDSKYLMDKEIENMQKFIDCGIKYGPRIAYKLFHECLPALEEGNLKPLGDLIFDYRFRMGSIENCSFVYPPILEISKSLEFLKLEGHADVLALSSVGPVMFAITKKADLCEKAFIGAGMKTIRTTVYNGRYKLINSK